MSARADTTMMIRRRRDPVGWFAAQTELADTIGPLRETDSTARRLRDMSPQLRELGFHMAQEAEAFLREVAVEQLLGKPHG